MSHPRARIKLSRPPSKNRSAYKLRPPALLCREPSRIIKLRGGSPGTPEERFEKIERQLAAINDSQVVTEELRHRSDLRFEKERAEVWAAIRRNDDLVATTQAALASLIATVDRFIQDQGGDGHTSTK